MNGKSRSADGGDDRVASSGTRSANGEGSIRRLPSGHYHLRVRLGKDKDGKEVRASLTGRTEAEVRRKRNEILVRHNQGLLPDPTAGRQSTATYLRSWLEGKRGTVEPSTWARYKLAIERHLVPLVGRVLLGRLAAADVRTAYAALLAEPYGLSPTSVRQAHVTLHQALRQAMHDGLLPRNVAAAVRPPKLPKTSVRALTPAEVSRLQATARGDWYALWLLALHTGLRLGELLALRWSDVSQQGPSGANCGAVTVRRAVATDEDQRPYLRPYPKSTSGVRVVPVGSDVVDALNALQTRQAAAKATAVRWADAEGLVFTSRFGTMLLKSNVVRTFKRDAAAARIAGAVAPHVLRHTFASSLLAAGRPVPEVVYLLGHGSPAVTMRVYAHFVPGAGEGVAVVLARYYATGADREAYRPAAEDPKAPVTSRHGRAAPATEPGSGANGSQNG